MRWTDRKTISIWDIRVRVGPWRNRRSPFFGNATLRLQLRHLTPQTSELFLLWRQPPISGYGPGPSAAAARIQRRSTVACISISLEACAAFTPRLITNFTASCLDSRRRNFLVMWIVQFHKHRISVSTKPAAGHLQALQLDIYRSRSFRARSSPTGQSGIELEVLTIAIDSPPKPSNSLTAKPSLEYEFCVHRPSSLDCTQDVDHLPR